MPDVTAHLPWLAEYPWLSMLLGVSALLLAAWAADCITRRVLLAAITRAVKSSPFTWDDALLERGVINRVAHVLPALVLYSGVAWLPQLPALLVSLTRNVSVAYIVLTLALALGKLLSTLNEHYERRDPERARARPIKGYIQLLQLVLYIVAGVLMLSALIDRSPLLLLSGLGAMTAVLLIVFRDTLLSLVAGIQLSSHDMLRVGDWIEMPQLHADGDVIDITLHTVKVQNWDRTITTIPTHRLIGESFRNWRGMSESGGRRIKRALRIDQTSVRFLGDDERERLRRFALIDDYLARKKGELEVWNARLLAEGKDPVNTRRVTNLGTFRAYVEAWLRAHPHIHPKMTLLVRQLEPGPTGLPLEIYCFTSTTDWAAYESIQGDIFDHLLAVLPAFDLRLFQEPTGADWRRLGAVAGV
ncbi:MAG TPA: mechanosensitive ion channel family protein [Arenimonas sp.]|nr:mechanosensitive ion channel family protein [Arenimonas sp.]